jgi:penicillin-insensitive murein endopeptidase
VYPLQGRSGADRKSVRLTRTAARLPRRSRGTEQAALLVAFVGVSAFGCVGPLAIDFGSSSLGTSADGALRHPAMLPFEGDGYAVPEPWRTRHANYGTEELVGAVARAARTVGREYAGGLAAVGDLSRRSGGGSTQHRSHQNGRDVDIFYYAADRQGQPVSLSEAMLHFAPDGRALRWSPPQGVRAPDRPIPDCHFDARRNWAFVRALLSDPDVEVQWIFMQRNLAAALLAEAALQGDDPALLARAAFIIHQPTDSEPHDDHMHVRLYCAPGDRQLGCSDRGPVRWWKKMWKYMRAPFGRPAVDGIGTDVEALGRLLGGEPPLDLVGAPPTS